MECQKIYISIVPQQEQSRGILVSRHYISILTISVFLILSFFLNSKMTVFDNDLKNTHLIIDKFESAPLTVDSRGYIVIGGIGKETSNLFTSVTDMMVNDVVEKEDNNIVIVLNSPGGSLYHAYIIIFQMNRLKEMGYNIITVVEKEKSCMSACGIIFASGDERIAHESATFMLHSPYYGSGINDLHPAERGYLEYDLDNSRNEYIKIMESVCGDSPIIRKAITDKKDHYFSIDSIQNACKNKNLFTEILRD